MEDELQNYAAICVIEKALAGVVNYSSAKHVSRIQKMNNMKHKLDEIKRRMIFRGHRGDNIASLSEFFNDNSAFVSKIF